MSLDEFRAIYLSEEKRVRRVIYRMYPDGDIDEMVQEVFVKAWKGLPLFQNRAGLSTWIYRIAINTVFDYFKKQKKNSSGEVLKENRSELSAAINKDLVKKGLDSLSIEHKTVLVLSYMEELSLEEISEILSIPQGTIKSRIHNAKKEFLMFLNENGVDYVEE